ncbi:MAG: serine/threonine protein kinase [Pseudonocardiales bacterium]|nr:serine/threonine protein kinase [Pseudonocardiales bacterium]
MTDPDAAAPSDPRPVDRPPTQTAHRHWWRSPAGAGAVVVALAALAVGGFFGAKALVRSRNSPTATPPVTSEVPNYLPPGAVACKKVYTDVHHPFNAGARGTPTTSCPFVEQVRRTYSLLSSTSAPTDQIHAVSPATEKSYDLACITIGSYVTCTGGAAAVVYLYNDPPEPR